MKRLQADPQEIDRGLAVLFRPGDVVELRIPKTEHQGTISGYFDDPQKLASALASQNGAFAGIYTTLNPCAPSLLARSANRARNHTRTTTSDKDIAERRWLLIDCDPKRPADISASDDEHAAALARAREIRTVLAEEGWPAPVFADSGNGAHLLYRVDLPNDEHATKLLDGVVLCALAARFSDAVVEIDRTVFNAARIVKAYGTVARKGDDLRDQRPHRLSRILDAPQAIEPVPHDGGRKWVLEECPFNADHKAPDAAIFEGADGKVGFKCLHNSCSGYHWRELRERIEGPRPKQESKSSAQKRRVQPPEFQLGRAVFECQDEPAVPVVEDLFFPGFTLLAGRPKSGKSWLALQTALAVARGTPLCQWLQVPKGGPVLYVALEEPRQRTTARMRKLQRPGDSVEALDNIRFVYSIPPMLAGGAAVLDAALTEWPALLVIIDTVRAFTRIRQRGNTDAVQVDYDVSDTLRQLAAKHRTALIGVEPTRKMPGDVIDSVIGTSGTTAGCDAVVGLSLTPGGDTVLTARGREHEELSYAMRLNNSPDKFGWEIFGSGDEARQSSERAEIIELLRHEAPLTPAKVALMLKKNANAVRAMLSRMVAAGRIVKQGNGYVLASQQ